MKWIHRWHLSHLLMQDQLTQQSGNLVHCCQGYTLLSFIPSLADTLFALPAMATSQPIATWCNIE